MSGERGVALPEGGPRRPAIRTPDQRLRVFVSPALEELAAERGAAREAIEQLRLAPVMFESGARAHPPQRYIRPIWSSPTSSSGSTGSVMAGSGRA
jgi:hypothetical protein